MSYSIANCADCLRYFAIEKINLTSSTSNFEKMNQTAKRILIAKRYRTKYEVFRIFRKKYKNEVLTIHISI